MKTLRLFLITNLSLFFSFLIHAEQEEEINFTADTLVNNMFRSFTFSPQGEEFLLGIKNVDYFYCEGKGVTKMTGDFFNEETPQPRMEFIFAYKDPNKDEAGWFAVSEPSMLDSFWLFVAMKKANEEKWTNIWDSKYSIVRGSHPMEDAVKATINDFILRLDVDMEEKSTENLFWQKAETGEIATLSTDWYITMNRNTKKFFWFSDQKKIMRLFAFPGESVSMDQKTTFEGDCSITKR